MQDEELRGKIELAMRYQLKELYNDFKFYEQLDQPGRFEQRMKEVIMDDIKDMLKAIKKFNKCTGDLGRFYGYMYELDENDEQKLICLNEEQCKGLPDISKI